MKQAYINQENLQNLGKWHKCCFDDATARLDAAGGALDMFQIPLNEIKATWAEQLSTQLTELPCELAF
jgi:hypothetical protein